MVGLVLAGGAARAAYEVGAVQYVTEEVAKALGRDVPIDILSGTSAGSINASVLAAFADQPSQRASILANRWTALRLNDVMRAAPREIFNIGATLLGRKAYRDARSGRRGGIFDARGLEMILRRSVPFRRIAGHMRAGLLSALSISTTHVASGRTVVFVQRAQGDAPRWGGDPTMVARAALIQSQHVLASAAVPILFPAVEIGGQYYCDGGLRQNVPLSPARRLGAERLVVINPRFIREETPTASTAQAREREYPDPLFIAGKAMNALLLDRVEDDISRLRHLNLVLAAGTARYGPGFGQALNEELEKMGARQLKPLDVVYIRSSTDLGVLAGEYVRSKEFATRVQGLLGRIIRRINDGEREADMLSYLLLDGEFAGRLIEIGRADARQHHHELVQLFARRLEL